MNRNYFPPSKNKISTREDETLLLHSELVYIMETNKSNNRYVNKMLCLLRRDNGYLFEGGESARSE